MERRIIIISDIHLASTSPPMMSRPDTLAAFIKWVSSSRRDGEDCELVIAGDFIDFLAVPPAQAFTADAVQASGKLREVFGKENRVVADALRQATSDGLELTVIVGNHDVELCHPQVQTTLSELLGLQVDRNVRFVAHGQAYRVGGLLVEHGNRYDGANENDWDGVRAWVSSHSRGKISHLDDLCMQNLSVQPSAGSQLVTGVIDGLRIRYPFVPLLQPEGVLTALLLRVLEPSLSADWTQVATILSARHAQGRRAPGKIRNIAGRADSRASLDPDLEAEFGDVYRKLMRREPSARAIGVTDWVKLFLNTRRDGLAERFRCGEKPPLDVLRPLQLILRKMELDIGPFAPHGPVGECGTRATRMVEGGDVETVVMGHTHAARSVGPSDRATYINTGTWSDIVSVPPVALEETNAGLDALGDFLMRLWCDDPACRQFVPTFADIAIDGEQVVHASLRLYDYAEEDRHAQAGGVT